jgi:hypothetical protein
MHISSDQGIEPLASKVGVSRVGYGAHVYIEEVYVLLYMQTPGLCV